MVCRECSEDIKEATAGIMFAARWRGDVPELLVARNILADKFGSDFTVAAKEGTGIVNPMVINFTLFISAFLAHPIDLKLEQIGEKDS